MNRTTFSNTFYKNNHKIKPYRRESLLLFFWIVITVVLILSIFVSYQFKIYVDSVPTFVALDTKVTERGENSILYDKFGTVLYTFKDPKRDREYVDYQNIPQSIKWAAVCAEDQNYFKHRGVDYIGILRSIERYVQTNGEEKIGGSTITQQLVKNTVLTPEKTIDRKVKEMIIAFMVEHEYSKEYILELYLNSAPFGGRLTGIKTAAKTYFGKELDQLTLEESVFLMSLIQRPGESSPLFSSNEQQAWDLVNERSDYIFAQMKKNYYSIKLLDSSFYSLEQIDEADNKTVVLKPDLGVINAPHFVFYIKDILEKPPYNINENDLYNGGYKIYSSLDLRLQTIAEKNIQEGIDKYKAYGMNNGSLIALDPNNGEVLAMVGSKNYWGVKDEQGKFDPHVNVTLSNRNLGSSLKPFLVYEAFREKKYWPYSTVFDQPINIRGYSPKNSDGTFMGVMTLKNALLLSRNTPFVQMLDNVGVDSFLNVLKSLGYKGAENGNEGSRYGLSMALGGFDANLLEHTHAYTALAKEGMQPTLRPILKIEKSNQELKFESQVVTNQVLDKEAVRNVNVILQYYGLKGTAGKTGTTDSNKDTYYIGYTDKLVTGIWMGNNNNASMIRTAFGSTTALPIWKLYYKDVVKEVPEYFSEISFYDPMPVVVPKPTGVNLNIVIPTPQATQTVTNNDN